MKRKPNKLVLALLGALHLAITTATWRDIHHRPASDIRGSKILWRLLSGANTAGSVAYLLIGRRSKPAG